MLYQLVDGWWNISGGTYKLRRRKMKKNHLLSISFLIFLMVFAIAGSPALAAFYQDNFTASITSTNSGTTAGYNPFGLSDGSGATPATTFQWWIQYDTNSIAGTPGSPSTIYFSGHPIDSNNQVTFLVPNGSGGTKNITKINDWSYDDTSGGPAGVLSEYPFNAATTMWNEFNFGGNTNYPGSFDLGPYDYLLIMDASTAYLAFINPDTDDYTYFYFDSGLENPNRSAVPIPGAILLLGSGLAAMTVLRRRRS
jgi:hypothetical protein